MPGKQRTPVLKEECLALVETGTPVTQVAEDKDVHRTTLHRWMKDAENDHPLVKAKRQELKTKFIEKGYEKVDELLDLIMERARGEGVSIKDLISALQTIYDKVSHAQGEPNTRHERRSSSMQVATRAERIVDYLQERGRKKVASN
jgi:transposase-like protein